MKALVLKQFGGIPEITDLPLPDPADGEVRIHVAATSVNGFDLAVAAGYLDGIMEHTFPLVLGKDVAGTVDAVGSGVTGYNIGDRVFGVVTKAHLGEGSFAEYVTTSVSGLAVIPEDLSFDGAAALGLAGCTALDAFDAAGIQPGQTVLVSGATGGVGSMLVQLSAQAGAHVTATARSETEQAHVTTLGASGTVGYTTDLTGMLASPQPESFDAVFHLAGDPASLVAATKAGGRLISTLLQSAEQVDAGAVTVIPIYANPVTATLNRLAENHTEGSTLVSIAHNYPLEQGAEALAHFGRGKTGKILISMPAH